MTNYSNTEKTRVDSNQKSKEEVKKAIEVIVNENNAKVQAARQKLLATIRE